METTPAPTLPRVATVLDTVAQFITRYVALPSYNEALVLAAWVIHTHAFEVAYATPYIYITSAEPECGKTRTLEVLEYAARNTTLSSSMSASSLYRRMMGADFARPTLLIDEVDALFNGAKNETLRGVLNSGYQRRGTVSITLPGKDDDSDVVDLPTFCPKIMAGIDNGNLPPTLASRAITITLRRKRPDQEVQRFLPRKVEPIADALVETITEWVKSHMEIIEDYEPEFVEGISDRGFEISEPLLQIAHAAGIEDEMRAALTVLLSKPKVTLTQGQQVLQAARDHFVNNDIDRVTTASLEVATGFNGKLIGSLLSKYEIKPMTLNKINAGKNAKGYYAYQLQDAIDTYLPGA